MTLLTLTYNGRKETFDDNDPAERAELIDLVGMLTEFDRPYDLEPTGGGDLPDEWESFAQHVTERTKNPTPNPVTDGGHELIAETGIQGEDAFQKLELVMTAGGERLKVGETSEKGEYRLLRVSPDCPGDSE